MTILLRSLLLLVLATAAGASVPIFPDADAVAASINTVCKLVSQRYDHPIATVRMMGIGPGVDDRLGPTFRVKCEMKLPFELADSLIETLAANPQVDLGRSLIDIEALPERVQVPDVQGAPLELAQTRWTMNLMVCPHGDNDIRQQRKDAWAALRLALTTREDRFREGRLAMLRRVEWNRAGVTVELFARDFVALQTASLRLAGLESRGQVSLNPCFASVRFVRVLGVAMPTPRFAAELFGELAPKARARLPDGLDAVTAAFAAAEHLQPALGRGPGAPQFIETLDLRPANNPKHPKALAVDAVLHGFFDTLGDSLERLWGNAMIAFEGGTLECALEPAEVPVMSGGVKRRLALARIRVRYTYGIPPATPNRAERVIELARGLTTALTGSRQAFVEGTRPALFSKLGLDRHNRISIEADTAGVEAAADVLESLGDERITAPHPVRLTATEVGGKAALRAVYQGAVVNGLADAPLGVAALRELQAWLKARPGSELFSAIFGTPAPRAPLPATLEVKPAGSSRAARQRVTLQLGR